MRCLTLIPPFVFTLLACGCGGNTAPQAAEWYEGGTLHQKTAEEWKLASARDRLATSADFAAKISKHSSMADLKTKATELDDCITKAVAPATTAKTPIVEIAAGCAVVFGGK